VCDLLLTRTGADIVMVALRDVLNDGALSLRGDGLCDAGTGGVLLGVHLSLSEGDFGK